MDEQNLFIKKRHSFCTTQSPTVTYSRGYYKSEANISSNLSETVENISFQSNKHFDQYYNKYDYDTVPVKDDASYIISSNQNSGDNKKSLTNSDLDKLELKILTKISQELQTDESSIGSLDSNIKIFKTTVHQIFDSFYKNLQDFERYKQKFNDIVSKSSGDTVADMEDFIKDMIKHIGPTEPSMTELKCQKMSDDHEVPNNATTVETFKNDHYLTDSTLDENLSKCLSEKKEETVNIYLLSDSPYLDIKLNDRSLFSEINIRHQHIKGIKELASAEDLEKVAAKKLQLERYIQQKKYHIRDRDLPVKSSSAKKNILEEEHSEDREESNKFFIFKICNYICRKLRKNAFG